MDMLRPLRFCLPALIGLALASGCGRAPSMGPDKAAFTAIDALFSAVSLRDVGQMERNAAELDRLHDAGRLPDAAHEALAAIIAEAKGGAWESANERLRNFMLDQRP